MVWGDVRAEYVYFCPDWGCVGAGGGFFGGSFLPPMVFLLADPGWFFFVCASMVLNVAFVLFLFVPHLSFVWCLGRTVLRDCCIF